MQYIFVFLFFAVLLYLLKSRSIKSYFSKEAANIAALNTNTYEYLVAHYSKLKTNDLIARVNAGGLSQEHDEAIRRVLRNRQAPPGF